MSKRGADGDALVASLRPNKRMALGSPVGVNSAYPDLDPDSEFVPDPDLDLNNDGDDMDDDFTSAQTPSSAADAESTVTAATTPRPKFPSDLKTLACTWPGCPKTFNRPARLRDHLNSHTNSRPFKCPYDGCDKDYIEDKHLKQHVKAVHTHERKHVCPREGCGKSFVTGTRLKRHQAVHEGADRFRCQECGQSFRKRETLGKHVRKDHRGLRAHPCPEAGCDAAFDSKPALKRHREREHGELRFWCVECATGQTVDGADDGIDGINGLGGAPHGAVGFTTEDLLQAHMKLEHQTCLFCDDFKSRSKWELDRHVEMRHSGKSVEDRKTFACPQDGCGKRFTTRSNLTTHVRSAHEGVRFICGEFPLSGPLYEGWGPGGQGCGDKFVTKARLEEHVRFIHLGHERPKLSRPAKAENLIDDISGVANQAKQTVVCPHCPETFIRYSDLALHESAVHGVDSQDAAKSNNSNNNNNLESNTSASADPAFFNPEGVLPDLDMGLGWNGDDNGNHPPAAAAAAEDDEEEIFAARVDYGMPEDEWLQDEANILLLARDDHQSDQAIDPALHNL